MQKTLNKKQKREQSKQAKRPSHNCIDVGSREAGTSKTKEIDATLFQEFYDLIDPAVFDAPYPTSQRKREDSAWVSSHREELTKYEGKWIAVYDKKVVASGKNGADVERRALRKIGHDVPDLYLRFLEKAFCVY